MQGKPQNFTQPVSTRALPDFTWIIYMLVYARPLAPPETPHAFIIIHVGCPFGTASNMRVCEDAPVTGAVSSSLLHSRPLML